MKLPSCHENIGNNWTAETQNATKNLNPSAMNFVNYTR
jgi:hypothetical protein